MIKDEKPFILATGGGVGTALVNLLILKNNVEAALSNWGMTPESFAIVVPKDYQALNPRFEIAQFDMYSGAPFLTVVSSISVTAAQIEALMQKHFGSLWKGLPKPKELPPGAASSMTKTILKRECPKEAPGKELRDCAALMGFSLDALPD